MDIIDKEDDPHDFTKSVEKLSDDGTKQRESLLRMLYKQQGLSEKQILAKLKKAGLEVAAAEKKEAKRKEAEAKAKKERKERRLAGLETKADIKERKRLKHIKKTHGADRKLKKMATSLFKMRFDDESGISNYYLSKFMEQYAAATLPLFIAWFDFIWKNQKDKEQSYGDSDFSFRKEFDGEWKGTRRASSTEEETKQLQVLYFSDHVSCGEYDKMIIIKEGGNVLPKFHVRIVYSKSDYRKGNQYVQCPNLKWYKDRGFNLDYIESLHMTPLGGSYADGRDKGFVLTAESDFFSRGAYKPQDVSMSRWYVFEHLCFNMHGACSEIARERKIKMPVPVKPHKIVDDFED